MPMVAGLDVLIVGAGIAGATLACLLGRGGHRVTVAELDQGVRSSGNPVDVRGEAYDVVDELGVLARLRAAATAVDRVLFVDGAGRPVGGLRTQRRPDRAFEISRSDLSGVLTEAARGVADFRFGETVTSMESDPSGVEVRFRHAEPARFDLVVGADGLHSTVRRIAFGPEERFVRPFGLYVAGCPFPDPSADPSVVTVHNEPGRSAAIHPGTGRPVAALIFRSEASVAPGDRLSVTDLLRRTYADGGWRDHELVQAFAAAPDVYFDQVSRVDVPSWSTGRVTLLGDAASCVSLFGEGSSSAIVGARTLARALATPEDLTAATTRYERRHRRQVRGGHRLAPVAAHLLVPRTRTGLTLRNTLLGRRRTGP